MIRTTIKSLNTWVPGMYIISNYMSSYRNNNPGLLEMVKSPDDNSELPDIFERVSRILSYYNSEEFE
jgi:hypothetical protein